MERFCKVSRIITLAPVLALFSLSMIFLFCKGIFPSFWHLTYMAMFLGALPLLAYPLQRFTPHFKHRGRDGQRTLAMIFAVSGYILSLAANIVFSASVGMWVICLEYLISGALILIFNKVFHIKVSAHGCGSAGPCFLLLYFGLWVPAIIMGVITFFAYFSSVKAKHHTFPQLLGGSAISILTLFVLALIFKALI